MLKWLRQKLGRTINPKLEQFAIMQTMIATSPMCFENQKSLKEYCDLLELQHINICNEFQKIFSEAKVVASSKLSEKAVCIRTFWAIQNCRLLTGRIVYIRLKRLWFWYTINKERDYVSNIADKSTFFLNSNSYENFITDTYYNLDM